MSPLETEKPAAANHMVEKELKIVKIENLFYNLKKLIDRNNFRGRDDISNLQPRFSAA
jgi:hypothetical protein